VMIKKRLRTKPLFWIQKSANLSIALSPL